MSLPITTITNIHTPPDTATLLILSSRSFGFFAGLGWRDGCGYGSEDGGGSLSME